MCHYNDKLTDVCWEINWILSGHNITNTDDGWVNVKVYLDGRIIMGFTRDTEYSRQ